MPENATAAVVGAVGGAGATRLAVEAGAALARDGRDVAVLDAAVATQGLAGYVDGRIDPDLTAVLVDEERSLSGALVDVGDAPGRLALAPSYAPFARIARAKTPAAARRFERLLGEAAGRFDHVLVDVPPVAANQAVAAVAAADRVALVAPATDRGSDAVGRARGRLADLGVAPDLVVANRADDPSPDADLAVPESDCTRASEGPACLARPEGEFAASVAATAEALLAVDLAPSAGPGGPLAAARALVEEATGGRD